MLAVLLGLSTQLGKVPLPEFVGNEPGATTHPLQYAQAGRKKRARIDLCPEQRKQESPSHLGSPDKSRSAAKP